MVQSLMLAKEFAITDKISIVIPTVGEILNSNEKSYYNIVSSIVATPYDFMVQFDDMHIDYESISEYELFMYLFQSFANEDVSLIFKNINIKKFVPYKNKENNEIVLYDDENDIIIDRFIYSQICDVIRQMHYFEKPRGKAANKEAKSYLIERKRKKKKSVENKAYKSMLTDLIISLVNTSEFKYNYETVMDLSIYKFNSSAKQIPKKMHYDHLMEACYAGTIDMKQVNADELNWMSVN